MSQELTSTTHTLTDQARAALDAGDVDTLLALSRARFGGWSMQAEGDGTGDGGEGDAGNADDGNDDGAGNDGNDDGNQADEDARVKRANAQAAKYRTDLRAAEAARDEAAATLERLRKAITGDEGDGNQADANQLTEQVGTLTSTVASLQSQLLVHELAGEHGGNPNALLDSHRFTTALQKLDASADDYRDQVAEAIKAAVKANQTLAAAGQVPSRGGAPGAGQGSADTGTVTQEQFNAMPLMKRNELFQSDPDTYRRLAAAIR